MKRIIVVDNIRSAYNVGSIFRTASGVGNCEIYICGISPTPEHIKVKKTALGAEGEIPWKYFKSTTQALKTLHDSNIPIWSVELDEKADLYNKVEYPDVVALVFGHETEGVKSETLLKSDRIIQIPMHGKKNSLNVATAVGIVLYESIK